MRFRTPELMIYVCAAAALCLAQPRAYADERSAQTESTISAQLLAVVAKRIDGYNAHDMPAFLAAHAEQVGIYEYPEQKIGTGHDHLEFVFAGQFARGQGHIDVIHQIVVGNRVISHEHITIDTRIERLVIIYTVADGVITAFRLIE